MRKHTFYHPKLAIKLTFPDGWRIETTPQGIQGISLIGDAIFGISTGRVSKGETAKDFAVNKMGLVIREGRDVTIANLPGFLGIADRAQSPFGVRPVRFAVLFDNRKHLAFILVGAGQYDLRNIAADRDFIATIFSFDIMDKEDFREARPPRIQIVRAEADTSMENLAASSPISNYALDKLRVMNGLYPSGEPEPGQLIKIVD